MKQQLLLGVLSSALLVGCSLGTDDTSETSAGDTTSTLTANPVLITKTVHANDSEVSAQCGDAGGIKLHAGVDENLNGTLDNDEIDETHIICNGAAGAQGEKGDTGATGEVGDTGATGSAGLSALLKSTTLASGEGGCVNGGVSLSYGIDDNRNNTLETSEIDDTKAVCHGSSGGANTPSVTQSSLDGGEAGWLPKIEVRFSAMLDSDTITPGSITLKDSNNVEQNLSLSYVNFRVYITPNKLLNGGQNYTLKLDGLKDILGNAVQTKEIAFMTATPQVSTTTSTVLRTGQTTIYELHDDGHTQRGVARSYTRSDDIVTDTVTGLSWQDNNDPSNYNWSEANTTCEGLNLSGFSDWHLPTIQELGTLVDYGRSSPAMDPIFQNITSSVVWSATTSASYTGNAWVVHFGSGSAAPSVSASFSDQVRCVRGRQ